MKKIVLPAIFLLWILQSACVTSLNPLVTYDRAITDNRLTGIWEKSDGQQFLIEPILESEFFKQEQKRSSLFENEKDIAKIESKEDSLLLSRSYLVQYKKGAGDYTLLVNFIRLNNQLFMNCMPITGTYTTHEGGGEDLDISGSMRSYTIAKVQWQNTNTIRLDFIDGDFLYEQIKAGRMKIKNETDELYDTFLITASTKELQQFLEKYGNDDRFFNKENSVILSRKS
jgi:hypothetical protein